MYIISRYIEPKMQKIVTATFYSYNQYIIVSFRKYNYTETNLSFGSEGILRVQNSFLFKTKVIFPVKFFSSFDFSLG